MKFLSKVLAIIIALNLSSCGGSKTPVAIEHQEDNNNSTRTDEASYEADVQVDEDCDGILDNEDPCPGINDNGERLNQDFDRDGMIFCVDKDGEFGKDCLGQVGGKATFDACGVCNGLATDPCSCD